MALARDVRTWSKLRFRMSSPAPSFSSSSPSHNLLCATTPPPAARRARGGHAARHNRRAAQLDLIADQIRTPMLNASHKIIAAPYGQPESRGEELWNGYVRCHPEGMEQFQAILAEAGHSIQDLYVHTAVALPTTNERECHYARTNPSFHGAPTFSHAVIMGSAVDGDGRRTTGVDSGGAEPQGAASSGVPAGASPRLSPQQLREWLVWRARLRGGATGAGGAGTARAGGAGVTVGAGGTGGTAATSPGGVRTRGTGVAGTGGVGGAGAGEPMEPGAARAEGTGAGGAGAGGAGAGGTDAGGAGVVGTSAGGAGAGGAGPVDPGSTVRPRPYFVPLIQQSGGLTERREPASRHVSSVRTTRRVPRSRPPPVPGTHAMELRPSSVPLCVPQPAPPDSTLRQVPDPESDRARAASPNVSHLLAFAVTDPSFEAAAASALVPELLDCAAAYRVDYATALVAESASASPPSVGGEFALSTDVLEDRQEEFECLAAALPRFASMLLAPEGDPDAPDIPTRALTQRRLRRDYDLHSLDFSTAFLHGSLHEEIWLCRPHGFTGSFPSGTQWSLRRPVYSLCQVPREWHDTLRTTLAALGFAPSTTDPSLFLRTDTSLLLFYVLVYVDDIVFATADTEALTLVKSELQKRHTCTDLGPSALRLLVLLATACSSVYRPLALSSTFGRVRPDLVYPLSLLAPYVAPGRHRKVHWDAVKRVLPYLCSTSGMGLVLGGQGPVVLTGHADASWVDDSTTQRSSQGYTFSLGSSSVSWWSTRSSSVLSSSCEAEINAGAMAAQDLRWLTYLVTDLGERPRSPPDLYVDNKAMIALCQEHRLEHRTKNIALRYFLSRELQQRDQLRLAYVATRANTADIFTKALPPGDHQRFSTTVLGLVPILPHLLTP
ncbi:unnamed protein product [Closterium sp. NIES-53]